MKLSQRFLEAVELALRLHGAQRRKVWGGPYVGHLLRVTGLVLEHGGDEEAAIAAVLHDAVEDQGGAATAEEIARRFGRPVADMVLALSDTDQTPKPPWRQRKEAALAHLASAPPMVRLIKAADKLDNVSTLLIAHRTMGDAVWAHFRGGREGTLWYAREVLRILRRDGSGTPLVEELAHRVAELEQLLGEQPGW